MPEVALQEDDSLARVSAVMALATGGGGRVGSFFPARSGIQCSDSLRIFD